MSPVRLSFFGPPCIEWDGNKREKLEPLPVGILAYLAVERHEHRRDDVANLFWPDAKDPRGTFRRQLPGLKKLIGKSRLLSNSGAIGLNFDSDIWIDVNRFSDLLTECKTHAHSEDDACPNCLDLLLEAEKLSSRGSFLRGHKLRNSTSEFERWYDDFARELNDQRHNVSERLVRYYLKDGSLKSAQEYAKRWKEVDGLDETVYRYRMWIYAQQGQRVRALNEYETFVRIFDGEEKFLSTEIKVLRDAIKNNQIPSLDEFLGSETKIKNGDQTCLDIPAVTSPDKTRRTDRQTLRASIPSSTQATPRTHRP
ncbi:hypothetical protein KFU94_36320 [Chloroflexi bacterium TSY]|nr:hypothetical protein [Chloroflexi bacterium TSY]